LKNGKPSDGIAQLTAMIRPNGKTLRGLSQSSGPPKVIIAHTICGKGVSFMEGKVEWHYLPLSDEQYIQAVREIQEAGAP
jgi:transketolase